MARVAQRRGVEELLEKRMKSAGNAQLKRNKLQKRADNYSETG